MPPFAFFRPTLTHLEPRTVPDVTPVEVGDVTRDGADDLVSVSGGSQVRVVDGATGMAVADFVAYEETFLGEVDVAVGDVNADGFADVITGAGYGGGPRVRVFDGQSLAAGSAVPTVLYDFFPYEDSFRGGVFVGAGDVNGDGRADVLTGAGIDGGPRVRAVGGDGTALADFFAGDAGLRDGARVAGRDVDGNGVDELVADNGQTVQTFDALGNSVPGAPADGGVQSFSAGAASTQGLVPRDLITFNDNGAWSWFEDERVVVDTARGIILSSTVANGDGPGGAARAGSVEVVAYHIKTGKIDRFTLRANLEEDDHDSAALFIRPDGRYVAMYSKHNTDRLTRWRVSTNPGDITSWGPEQTRTNGANTTYANLYYLSAENSGKGRLYDFTRTIEFDPHILVSNDHGSTWLAGGRLLDDNGPTNTAQGQRPYVRYASNGVDRIHFIATDGHPRNVPDNSIYHGYIQNGQIFNSNGTLVDPALTGSAMAPNAYTKVFQGGPTAEHPENGPAWTTDIQLDASGNPYVVFSVRTQEQVEDGKKWDHDYYYGRFDGSQWHVHRLAYAGKELYGAEGDYTGLVALDPHDPNRVVISTDEHPVTGQPLVSATDGKRHYELFEGRTTDGGATWTWTPITADSAEDNLRPVIPIWNAEHSALFWLRGTYTTFTQYNLKVVGTVTAVADTPVLTVTPTAAGNEAAAIPLNIAAAHGDSDGSEVLSVTVAGVPAGGTLSAGTDNGGGTWTLTPAQLAGLTLTLPDNLPGEAPFTLTVTATATETTYGSTASASAAIDVTVRNVAPTAAITVGATSGVRGQTLSYAGTFTDPGADAHTLAWTVTRNGAVYATGTGAAFSFTPTAVGTYQVAFTVTDDDGGTTTATSTVAVTAAAVQPDPITPGASVLVVGGTTAADLITITPDGSPGRVVVSINGTVVGTFGSFDRIAVYAQDGDDNVQVSGGVTMPAWLYGGGGNDRLYGGGGDSLLVGGDGNDQLLGGQGRDLMIGSRGADQLVANADDDILIAGVFLFEDDPAKAGAVMREWTRTDKAGAERVANLRNGTGLNGPVVLTAATIVSDPDADTLTGSSGYDWFLYDPTRDRMTGGSGEATTTIS